MEAFTRRWIAHGTPVDIRTEQETTPLMTSHKEIMVELLNCGADIDAVNKDGNTILHKAILGHFQECVDFLILRGADQHYELFDQLQTKDFKLSPIQSYNYNESWFVIYVNTCFIRNMYQRFHSIQMESHKRLEYSRIR